jgi:2-keto-4-pentenoate hydratase/2-oxohepta-3-ene-1,7-dioic acid hydratase in catechol pathway
MVIIRYQSAHGPAFGVVENHIVYALEGDVFGPFSRGREIGALPDVQLLAPIAPGKILALGRNYAEHAKEHGASVPKEPLLFLKATSAVIAPDEPIVTTPLSEDIEHEAELVVVIGKRARHVSEERAWDYVLGVTCGNDVTARDLQNRDGQWARSKSFDTFCPLGPWIVTRDEMPDPHRLPIRCTVNGEVVQKSNTDQLIFRIPDLIEYLSRAFTLLPGDIILTGTPPGVGHFRNPPRYLQDGDTVVVEIDGIGALVNVCRTE